MARQSVSTELKAQAMADLLAGEQPAVVAHRYGLNRDTVKKWKQRLSPDLSPPMGGDKSGDNDTHTTPMQYPAIVDRQARIGALILEVLEARLRTSLAITHHIQHHDDWINTQTAADLAALDGHLHRTTVDVLDRLAGSRRATDDPSGS